MRGDFRGNLATHLKHQTSHLASNRSLSAQLHHLVYHVYMLAYGQDIVRILDAA